MGSEGLPRHYCEMVFGTNDLRVDWRKLVLLIGLFSCGFMTPSVAAAQGMFVGFDEFCGLPVVVGRDPQTASARRDSNGQAFIHIDAGAMANWTTSQKFAIAHECAHHLLGHTTALGQRQRYLGGTRRQELEADCWAAKQLMRLRLITDINRTIVERASQGHFSSGGYPSGAERAQLVAECAGIRTRRQGPQCRNVRSPCQHQAHPQGDRVACRHVGLAHPRGDIVRCQHACPSYYGPVPCHPRGDVIPCQHTVAAHRFDVIPCTHPAHPTGDVTQVCD